MNHFSFELPILAPPLNNAYMNIPKRGRVLTPQARAWKESAANVIRAAMSAANWNSAPPVRLNVEVTMTHPRVYTWDIDGRVKLLLDAISAASGVDDRYVVALTVYKDRGEELCKCTVMRAG